MKNKSKFLKLLKEVAEKLIMSAPTDVRPLSEIHTAFDEISKLAEKQKLNDLSEIASAARELTECIILEEVKNPEKSMEALGKTISNLQLFFEGHEMSEMVFPKELGLDSKSAPGKKSASSDKKASSEPEKKTGETPVHHHADKKDTEEDPGKDEASAIARSYTSALESDPDLVADFVNESIEHLDSCNGHLLTIESNPEDLDALNAVFRAFHTIKGVASFLNLTYIRELAHEAESLLDKARSQTLVLADELMDLVFESLDTMKQMIEDLSFTMQTGKPHSTLKNVSTLISRLHVALTGESPQTEEVPAEEEFEVEQGEASLPLEVILAELPQLIEELEEHIEIAEEQILKLEKDPQEKAALDHLFRSFHTVKGTSAFLGLSAIETLAHKAENLLDKARTEGGELEAGNMELVFESVDSFKKIALALKDIVKSGTKDLTLPEFPQLVRKLDAAAGNGDDFELDRVKPSAPPRVPEKNEKEPKPSPQTIKKAVLKETVKVDSDRLDRLVDTIGELVIAETMVIQDEELRSKVSPKVLQNLSHLDKITRELQEMGTSLRMVPVHSTFQKMARLVRDLSKKEKKEIDFVMTGEETELDKTVVDKIGDPLVHMVRNAVDHGIEKTTEEREKAGKSPKARVDLRAFHKGGNIYIEVEDDGRGLNKEVIYQKAVDKGIISPDENLSDKEIYSLIFAPGFSTAQKITEISGRGVGMDVVKRNIEELRGQIEIQSELGCGSVFSIRLPLTLAIIDGMVISVENERYIIPTLSIVMSLHLSRDDIKTVQGKGEMIQVQGELIPVFHLDRIFGIERRKELPEELLVVVVEDDRKKTGILIDELIGQQQIVIKNLGDFLKNTEGISGGAIMGDGSVGLILDVSGLVRLANEKT